MQVSEFYKVKIDKEKRFGEHLDTLTKILPSRKRISGKIDL